MGSEQLAAHISRIYFYRSTQDDVMEEATQLKCAKCRKPLRLGVDVITLEHGVIGPRGVVPFLDIELFCSDACLEESVDSSEVEHLPRKIP